MKNKLRISELQFKQYLLDHYVDSEGRKVSDRIVWNNEEFFDYTGMFGINKYTGERKMLSTGTISYWKAKLDVREEDVFLYHQNVTKKIPKDIDYEEWSRKNNKGYEKVAAYNRETVKRRLIKYAGIPEKYRYKTLDELVLIVLKTWDTLGMDAENEMRKFYHNNV